MPVLKSMPFSDFSKNFFDIVLNLDGEIIQKVVDSYHAVLENVSFTLCQANVVLHMILSQPNFYSKTIADIKERVAKKIVQGGEVSLINCLFTHTIIEYAIACSTGTRFDATWFINEVFRLGQQSILNALDKDSLFVTNLNCPEEFLRFLHAHVSWFSDNSVFGATTTRTCLECNKTSDSFAMNSSVLTLGFISGETIQALVNAIFEVTADCDHTCEKCKLSSRRSLTGLKGGSAAIVPSGRGPPMFWAYLKRQRFSGIKDKASIDVLKPITINTAEGLSTYVPLSFGAHTNGHWLSYVSKLKIWLKICDVLGTVVATSPAIIGSTEQSLIRYVRSDEVSPAAYPVFAGLHPRTAAGMLQMPVVVPPVVPAANFKPVVSILASDPATVGTAPAVNDPMNPKLNPFSRKYPADVTAKPALVVPQTVVTEPAPKPAAITATSIKLSVESTKTAPAKSVSKPVATEAVCKIPVSVDALLNTVLKKIHNNEFENKDQLSDSLTALVDTAVRTMCEPLSFRTNASPEGFYCCLNAFLGIPAECGEVTAVFAENFHKFITAENNCSPGNFVYLRGIKNTPINERTPNLFAGLVESKEMAKNGFYDAALTVRPLLSMIEKRSGDAPFTLDNILLLQPNVNHIYLLVEKYCAKNISYENLVNDMATITFGGQFVMNDPLQSDVFRGYALFEKTGCGDLQFSRTCLEKLKKLSERSPETPIHIMALLNSDHFNFYANVDKLHTIPESALKFLLKEEFCCRNEDLSVNLGTVVTKNISASDGILPEAIGNTLFPSVALTATVVLL